MTFLFFSNEQVNQTRVPFEFCILYKVSQCQNVTRIVNACDTGDFLKIAMERENSCKHLSRFIQGSSKFLIIFHYLKILFFLETVYKCKAVFPE